MRPFGSLGPRIDASRYGEQLAEKVAAVRGVLDGSMPAATLAAADVYPSPPTGHRLRAGPLAIVPADEGRGLEFAMWDPVAHGHSIVRAEEVPIYAPPIAAALEAMRVLPIELSEEAGGAGGACALAAAEGEEPWGRTLGRGLRSASFHSTLSGELLVCLCYHDPRLQGLRRSEVLPGSELQDEAWRAAAAVLRAALREALASARFACTARAASEASVDIVGRWKRRRLAVERDGVTERFHLRGRELVYWQPEGQFSNPNGPCEVHCLEWLCREAEAIRSACDPGRSRLLELHCGGGNNTVALAPYFDEVVAVEINRSLADAASGNLRANGIENVRVVRSPSALAAGRLSGAGEQGAGLRGELQAVLVDPPRSGLDQETRELVRGFEHVLYISCNPRALADDLGALHSHEAVSFAIFDMFPYTTHAEVAVRLRRVARAGVGSPLGAGLEARAEAAGAAGPAEGSAVQASR